MTTFPMSTKLSRAMAAAVASLATCIAMPASAQVAPTVLQTTTSRDGALTLQLASVNPSDVAGVNNTYLWSVTNTSTATLTGVALGSHFGDWCGVANCTPPGPTIIAVGPGCAIQTGDGEIPVDANFGVWCVPLTGVTLAPGQSANGTVTLRPTAGGPPDYTVYAGLIDTFGQIPDVIVATNRNVVAPAPTDIQLKGAASNGSPPAGSTFTYTYEIKNSGPWGTFGGIAFVDTLPESLTYVGSFVTLIAPLTGQLVNANVCSAVGQTVMCQLGDMENGGALGQRTVTITVAASPVAQQIVNTASVHTALPQTDSNTANNSATVTVTSK
jgi:uncharacterized repeat protein (TIGR01451 family)